MATISEALAIAAEQHRLGRFDLAEEICRRILRAEPDTAEALHMLGLAAHHQGRHADAVAPLQRAVELAPREAGYHNSLGEARRALGDAEEAGACYARALELAPDYAAACYNLGLLRQGQGRRDEAISCYRRAIALGLQVPMAHNNLGVLLQTQGKIGEAIDCFQEALKLNAADADALNNLGCARRDLGQLDEATACYRRALELAPQNADVASNLLLTLQYRPGVTPAELAAAHGEYDRIHAAPLRAFQRKHENTPDPNRPLRLGFVSADFKRHPIGFFLAGVLENLDRAQCEAWCYSDGLAADDVAERLRAASGVWQAVAGVSDDALAERIRADRIDVLFDLAGHMSNNRLLVFARRPAPVQIAWLGYPGTTGLAAMDDLLADRHQAPDGSEQYFAEKVLRMPDGYACYAPPSYAPPVGPLPAISAGHVTFGSFNNPAKLNPELIAAWAQILGRVPGARLILKFTGLDDAGLRAHYERMFAGHGIAPDRLEFSGSAVHEQLLASYNRMDIALDTRPYSGGLTTCEALWMGVPVVTFPGDTFAGRHSLAHLESAGLAEMVARDWAGYVELAVRMGQELPRLARLRAGLREQVARSPLCDATRFARNLVDVLRGVWREWCEAGQRSV